DDAQDVADLAYDAAPSPEVDLDPTVPPPTRRRAPAIKRTPPPPAPLLTPEPPATPAERRMGAYVLPPPNLLDPPKDEHKIDERELMEAARLLEEKCREFSVDGSVMQIHPGPVVTTY